MSWLLPRKVAKNDKWQKNIQALLHVTYLFLGGSRKKSAHFATPTGGHAQFCSQVFCYMFPPNRQQIRKTMKSDWLGSGSVTPERGTAKFILAKKLGDIMGAFHSDNYASSLLGHVTWRSIEVWHEQGCKCIPKERGTTGVSCLLICLLWKQLY